MRQTDHRSHRRAGRSREATHREVRRLSGRRGHSLLVAQSQPALRFTPSVIRQSDVTSPMHENSVIFLSDRSACASETDRMSNMESVVIGTPLLLALKCFGPGGCRQRIFMGPCDTSLIKSQYIARLWAGVSGRISQREFARSAARQSPDRAFDVPRTLATTTAVMAVRSATP